MSIVTIYVMADDPTRFSSVDDPDDTIGTSEETIAADPGQPLGEAVFLRLLALEREFEANGGAFHSWVPDYDSLPAFIGAACDLAGANIGARRLIVRARRVLDYVRSSVGGIDPWGPQPWLDGKTVHAATQDIGNYVVDEYTRLHAEYVKRQIAMPWAVQP